MSCCPPNAEKYLAPDYSAIGSILTLDSGYEAYQTGDVTATKKAVILIPDIYGWNGGRTRNIADYLVGYGYYVVVPKLLTPPIDGGTDGDGEFTTDRISPYVHVFSALLYLRVVQDSSLSKVLSISLLD